MTGVAPAAGAAQPPRRVWLRPPVVLPVIGALILVVALLTPEATGARSGDARLSTENAGSMGARLLYELAGRLHWEVSRWTTDSLPLDSTTIAAVLDPVEPPSAGQSHAILQQVRHGGALLYVLGGGALDDSLHVHAGGGGTYVPTPAGSDMSAPAIAADSANEGALDMRPPVDERGECTERTGAYGGGIPLWPGGSMYLGRLQWASGRPAGAVSFADTRASSTGTPHGGRIDPVAMGFPLGRGRVVVIADPDLLRNDVLRVCAWGADVVAVRMLEYLSASSVRRRDRVVFDEYHQGIGAHPGTMRAVILYLRRTDSGHMLLQALAGGLLLLLAFGPRALPPRDSDRVERRSPLEHVTALARAYDQVGATRTATARLLHGVRRRVEPVSRRKVARGSELSDDVFLGSAERVVPALAPDVALIRRALSSTLPPAELERVGGALRRLEISLLTQWK